MIIYFKFIENFNYMASKDFQMTKAVQLMFDWKNIFIICFDFMLIAGCACFYLEMNLKEKFQQKQRIIKAKTHVRAENCVNESRDVARSYYQQDIKVSYCVFSRSSMLDDDGGIIFVNHNSLSMDVSYTTFYNCTAINGGAISFSSGEDSILKAICAFQCSALNNYHFGEIKSDSTNQLVFVSITSCSSSTKGFETIRFSWGDQIISDSNFSMNSAKKTAAFNSNTQDSAQASHCTFSNNNVSDDSCIVIGAVKNWNFSLCNIVHCNGPSNGVVTITGKVYIANSIFSNNHDNLFYVHQFCSLEIADCYINHIGNISSGNVIMTKNNSFTNCNTYQFEMFDSFYCHADKTPKKSSNGLTYVLVSVAAISLLSVGCCESKKCKKCTKDTAE